MKLIPLTKGKFAIVDDEDFDELNKHKWCCLNGYAARRCGPRMQLMHRVICGTQGSLHTDHRDGSRLNNMRSNLRACTLAENNRNKAKGVKNKSGFKGVSFSKNRKKFHAQISVAKVHKSLGFFSTAEAAYSAYCKAAPSQHGEFAKI